MKFKLFKILNRIFLSFTKEFYESMFGKKYVVHDAIEDVKALQEHVMHVLLCFRRGQEKKKKKKKKNRFI